MFLYIWVLFFGHCSSFQGRPYKWKDLPAHHAKHVANIMFCLSSSVSKDEISVSPFFDDGTSYDTSVVR